MKVIDLFAGCGGFSQAFRAEGFSVHGAVEFDAEAATSYALNFPEAKLWDEDIRNVTGRELAGDIEGPLVVIGGPPCQGYSTLTRKQGWNDDRNRLILEFLRIVREIGPVAFVMENVPSARRPENEHWSVAFSEFAEMGYRLTTMDLDSADFGAPQRRKRGFLCGWMGSGPAISAPWPTHGTRKGLKPFVTVREAIGNLDRIGNEEYHPDDPLHYTLALAPHTLERMKHIPPDGGGRMSIPDQMVLDCHRKNVGFKDVYGRLWWDRPAPTITAGCVRPSKGRFTHPEQDRGLTLREAARLQGFPDDFQFRGGRDSMARQIGNAVPIALGSAIARVVYRKVAALQRETAGSSA